MPSLAEVLEEMNTKSKFLDDVLREAGPDLDMDKVTLIRGNSETKVAEFQRLHKEINDLGQQRDRLETVKMAGELNRSRLAELTEPKDRPEFKVVPDGGGRMKVWTPRALREAFAEHKGLKAFREGQVRTVQIDLPDLDIKTLITLATVSPQAQRLPPVEMGLEERTVGDLMLDGTTTSNTIDYYEETTSTNTAAETAEGTAYPESTEAWTLRTENVRDIGHFIPATRDSIDDVDFLEGTVRGRLSFGVRRREETQLLTGNGTAPNLLGILNRVGIQTQAKGADPTPDAVYKAGQLVRGSAGSGFAEPTAFICHPSDWTDIRLLRTADGIYIWGAPSEPGPDRIWGWPVRQTTVLTAGTGLIGAFRPYAQIFRRTGVTVTLSTEHSTFFTERKVAIMAEERIALAIYRPAAFATVTGI